MANRKGKGRSSDRFSLLGLQNHCGRWQQPWNQKMIASWQESNDEPRQCVEKQQHYSADKGPYSLGYGLPSGCESWTVKKAEHQRIDASELWYWRILLQVHWMAKRSNHSMLRETNSEYFTGRTAAEAPIFRSSDMKRWLTEKVPDAGKDRVQREEGIRGWMPSLMQWIWTWANSGR